jgi:hypothetical protein
MQSRQAELLSEDTAWEVEAELAFHDDDPKAAIAALIGIVGVCTASLHWPLRRAAQATPGDGARDLDDVRAAVLEGSGELPSRQASTSPRRLYMPDLVSTRSSTLLRLAEEKVVERLPGNGLRVLEADGC